MVVHHPDSARARLAPVIEACVRATAPGRGLDMRIALAVFPALCELVPVDEGVWRQADGTHARALRYSASRSAALTLVPPGYWLEAEEMAVRVCGASGVWIGIHQLEAIRICIAALRARAAPKDAEFI